MTVASAQNKAGPFLDTGGFAFPFSLQVFGANDIKVVRTTKAGDLFSDAVLDLGTDYSVALNPDQEATPGGTVTTVSSAPGTYITIVRNISPTQGTSIPNQGGFYPEVLERALDKLTMLTQQLQADIERSLLLSYADTGTSLDGVIAALTSAVDEATSAASAASSSASAAGTSAADAGISETNAVAAGIAAVTARAEAEGFRDEARDYATEQLIATSATSLTPGAGNKNFTIQANKAFVLGMYLVATSSSTPADYMAGEVVSYDRATGALVLSVDDFSGTTARTDWVIGIGSKGGDGSSPTSGPSIVTLYRVGDLLDSVSFTQDGITGAVYLTRSSGRLSQVVTTFNGKTRTETFNYTGNVLTSVTAVES